MPYISGTERGNCSISRVTFRSAHTYTLTLHKTSIDILQRLHHRFLICEMTHGLLTLQSDHGHTASSKEVCYYSYGFEVCVLMDIMDGCALVWAFIALWIWVNVKEESLEVCVESCRKSRCERNPLMLLKGAVWRNGEKGASLLGWLSDFELLFWSTW